MYHSLKVPPPRFPILGGGAFFLTKDNVRLYVNPEDTQSELKLIGESLDKLNVGSNNILGGYGYYYSSIRQESDGTATILLSRIPLISCWTGQDDKIPEYDENNPKTDFYRPVPDWKNPTAWGEDSWQVGDRLSIFNWKNYDCICKIISINTEGSVHYIRVDYLPDMSGTATWTKPDGTEETIEINNFHGWTLDNSIINIDKPQSGIIPFSSNSVSIGAYNSSLMEESVALGLNTKAIGKYSLTHGRDSIAGYASFASGFNTNAIGNSSVAINVNNTASGSESFAGGNGSLASERLTFAWGTRAKATSSKQIVFGNDNVENSNALFIIGNGTSSASKYNSIEVLKDKNINLNGPTNILTKAIIGTDCSCTSSHSISAGYKTKIDSSKNINFAFGRNLNITGTIQDQFVIGRYNKSDSDAHFIVGNGNDGSLSNAFVVTKGGAIRLGAASYGTTDLTDNSSSLATGQLYFVY